MNDSLEVIEKKCDDAWKRYYGACAELDRLQSEAAKVAEIADQLYEDAMGLDWVIFYMTGGYRGAKVLRTTTASHTE